VLQGFLGADTEGFLADHRGQFQLPVVGRGIGRQYEVVGGGSDRRREPDEEVRRALAGPLVHHGRRRGPDFGFVLAWFAVGSGEVDHVGTGLQDLDRFHRSQDLDVGQRQASYLAGGRRKGVQLTLEGVPVPDQ